ncbi:MAG: alpha/beta fold hydrolase [Nocardiopsaceae bacterium]|nr:alpha/beta fold hydrolase [Nocardiopsaceae bacterium]
MASNPRLAERLRRSPAVHTVPRPIHPGGPETFDLGYVREGRPGGIPLLIVPGGPGLASVLPYRKVRRMAAARGFDVIMVEHRGVGLSRTDRSGADLPMDALTIEAAAGDIAAVLDDCELERAVVWGSSYGGYLAQAFGARHGDRVSGMVLDSASTSSADDAAARDHVRRLLWHGDDEFGTVEVAEKLRELVAQGRVPVEETGPVVPVVYEFGGVALLDHLLDAVAGGRRRTWNQVRQLATREITSVVPYALEFDLVGAIWFRELARDRPDGKPLDTSVGLADLADRFPEFQGEPFDMAVEQRRFTWPTAVLTGDYDLRSVRPLAEDIVDRVPDAVLVPFDRLGHSMLDRHPFAGLAAAAAVANGRHHDLPRYADRIQRVRQPLSARALGTFLRASLALETAVPRSAATDTAGHPS